MYAITEQTPSSEIKAAYDAWADAYDDDLVAQNGYAMPERAADALARHVSEPDASIIDVGCGTGLSGVAARKRGFTRLDGCDLSPGMLAHAEAVSVYGRLFEANLLEPPIDCDDATYDAALVCGVFSAGHLNPEAVQEILRLVKPGGAIVLTVNDHYEDDGKLGHKLEALAAAGIVTRLSSEYGDHIPERNVGGWVYVVRKA